MNELPAVAVAGIRAALLAFFDDSARALPWRGSRDPYRILVSEVMAQQTRIETVIPYFERWLRRFPDIDALADAPEDDVLREWAGLGYYSRARNLHAAARVIRERHAGAVPSSYDALRALPGVGEYTAGAVASIVFDVPAPAVDGNVRRVLARLLDEPAPSPRRLRQAAQALVPAERPGDFNQAFMELGSRICTPRSPRCGRCPVSAWCAARAAGTQLARPAPKPKRAVPVVDLATAVIRREDGRVLLVRRPARGLLAGMWSFPADELADDGAGRVATHIAQTELPGAATSRPEPLAIVEHAFSHRRERYHCFLVKVGSPPEPASRHAWAGPDAADYALPRAQQRIHGLAFDTAFDAQSAGL